MWQKHGKYVNKETKFDIVFIFGAIQMSDAF